MVDLLPPKHENHPLVSGSLARVGLADDRRKCFGPARAILALEGRSCRTKIAIHLARDLAKPGRGIARISDRLVR